MIPRGQNHLRPSDPPTSRFCPTTPVASTMLMMCLDSCLQLIVRGYRTFSAAIWTRCKKVLFASSGYGGKDQRLQLWYAEWWTRSLLGVALVHTPLASGRCPTTCGTDVQIARKGSSWQVYPQIGHAYLPLLDDASIISGIPRNMSVRGIT